jgi:hypothetical protein
METWLINFKNIDSDRLVDHISVVPTSDFSFAAANIKIYREKYVIKGRNSSPHWSFILELRPLKFSIFSKQTLRI